MKKNIELIVHNSSVPHLIGDEKRIRQIIVNLLNNAIKYTDRGRVTLTSGYQDGNLNISIERYRLRDCQNTICNRFFLHLCRSIQTTL